MAYIPLHHKYRPQTFADLVGQEAIATTLTNALKLQKIAPAYLFTGPRGTGKTSSARILAKSLNCMLSPVPTAQPCGSCDVCQSIALGAALDIIEIDAASNTGVDNIREIIERAQYAPVQCRYKVYIIDECHMLTTAAFNSLLKTLEEPPPHVVFVLATTDPQRVLPTIISRCQRFDYRRIPVDAMVGHLKYIAQVEQIEIQTAAIKTISQIAQGGLRDAESLLDRLSLFDGEITPDQVWEAIGSVPEQDLLEILQAIVANDPESLLTRTTQILERGKEPITILQNLAGCYRDLLIAKTAPNRSDLVALTDETWVDLCKIAQGWQINWILAGQQHLKDSEIQLKHSTQPRLWLEITLCGLLTVRQEQAQPQIIQVATPPPQPSQGSPLPSIPASQPIALTPVVSTSTPQENRLEQPAIALGHPNLITLWGQVLEKLKPSTQSLYGGYGQLTSITEEQAIVTFKPTMKNIAEGKIPELAKAFSSILGRPIGVKLATTGQSSPPQIALSPAPVPSPSRSVPPPDLPPILPTPVKSVGVASSVGNQQSLTTETISHPQPNIEPEALLPVEDAVRLIVAKHEPETLLSTQESIELDNPDLHQPLDDSMDLTPPMDFAEPPDSLDLDRATSLAEPLPWRIALNGVEEPELDPLVQSATERIVKSFDGEIIDRTDAIFNKIISPHPSSSAIE
jgi:DNA polymerase III subunit gamma/tau